MVLKSLVKNENPKTVLKAAAGAQRLRQLRRAREEDRIDAAWARQCNQVRRTVLKRSRLVGFDLMLELVRATPPHPPGWFERRTICNRCGTRIQRDERRDAYYCRVCRRWLEPRCGDRACWFCRGRPARAPAV